MKLYDIVNKPNKIILLALFIFTALTLLSCGGKPEADDTPIDSNAKVGLQVNDIIYNLGEVSNGNQKIFYVTVSNSGTIPLWFDNRRGQFEVVNDPAPTGGGYGAESFEIVEVGTAPLARCKLDNPDPIPKTGCSIVVKFTARFDEKNRDEEIRTVLEIWAKDKDNIVQGKYTTFKGKVVPGEAPIITVATTAYIGNAQTTPIENDVIVYNTGAKVLTIKSSSIPDDETGNFAIEEKGKTCNSLDGKVAKGSSCRIPISFTPPESLTPGTYTAKLLIKSDAGDATVTLSGLVKEPITIYPNNKVLDFGKVRIGSSATSQIRITNNTSHDKDLRVTVEPDTLHYKVGCVDKLIKGNSCIVTVTVTPADMTTDLASVITLTAKNTDGSSEYTEKLSTKAEPVAAETAIATLTVSPDFYAFNKLANYVNTTQSLNISNDGNADLTINSISIEDLGDFTISNSSCADKLLLPPTKSCSLDVTFNTSGGYERYSALDINTSAGTKILKMQGNPEEVFFGIKSDMPADIRMTMPPATVFQVATSDPVALMNIGTSTINLSGMTNINNINNTNKIVNIARDSKTCGDTLARGATCYLYFLPVTKTKLDGVVEKLVLSETPLINIYLTANVLIPSFVKGTSVGQIYVNGNSVFALDIKGDLYSWGDNKHAQLGVDNSITYLSIPTYISVMADGEDMPTLSELVTSSEYTLGISKDRKTVYGWGYQIYNRLGVVRDINHVDDLANLQPTQVSLHDAYESLMVKKLYSGSSGFSVLLHALEGQIQSWGNSSSGQTGQGYTRNATITTPLSSGAIAADKTIIDIAVGDDFAFAIGSDRNIYAWGNNRNGQLALGASTDSVVAPTKIDTGNVKFSKIFIDNGSSVNVTALSTDNKLYAWGMNSKGQLGNGLIVPTTTYMKVMLQDNIKVQSLYIGKDYKIARSSDGKIYGWGDNSNGLLKNTDDTIVATPVQIKMPDDAPVREVYTADDHIFAVTNGGKLYAWGKNNSKQLGLGDLTEANQPTLVVTTTTVSKLYLKNSFTFMLSTDGKLYAWGDNSKSNLGIMHIQPNIPQEVVIQKNSTVKDVYLGDTFTIILDTKGMLYSVGQNDKGQLGADDKSTYKTQPYSIFDTSLNKP